MFTKAIGSCSEVNKIDNKWICSITEYRRNWNFFVTKTDIKIYSLDKPSSFWKMPKIVKKKSNIMPTQNIIHLCRKSPSTCGYVSNKFFNFEQSQRQSHNQWS